MELPREIEVYIYSFLYDKWRVRWNLVMKEILSLEEKTKILNISRFMIKEWKLERPKEIKICLDCGEYYNVRFYGSMAMWCDCP